MSSWKKKIKPPLTVDQKIKRRNFISFGAFFALNATAYGTIKWLGNAPDETPGATAGAAKPFRRALNKTELAFRRLFSRNHMVKTYDKSKAAKKVRQNGNVGLQQPIYISDWKLHIKRTSGEELMISLAEIKKLPKTELVFDFKCVEGWDQIQHWGGVKLEDFIKHFDLHDEAKSNYVGLETPDKKYYVGLDIESALHPQTILAYEMNGRPLTLPHGAPLRLIVPVKYGIKNLKRIGTITFGNQRPPDYWAKRGYDYYSGL